LFNDGSDPTQPATRADCIRLATILFASTFFLAGPAGPSGTLPDIPLAQYDAEQKTAAEEFQAARKVALSGPFQTMMYSPEVMSRARHGRLPALPRGHRQHAERAGDPDHRAGVDAGLRMVGAPADRGPPR